MTLDYTKDSLLKDLSKYSGVHLDSSLINAAVAHNEALQLSLPSTNGNAEKASALAFGHMTSNQFIALSHLNRTDDVGKQESEEILNWSLEWIQNLFKNFDSLKDEEKNILNDSSLFGGLKKRNKEGLEQLIVDVASIRIGLLMIPYLLPTGYFMCQSLPSLAYSSPNTLAHARRLHLLSHLIAKDLKLDYKLEERLCVKVPSSYEGLKACSEMKKLGIKALATTVFCPEQGLTAMEASEVKLISPYVRTLSSHFYDANKTPKESRLYDEATPGLEVVRSLQIQFNRRKASKLDNGSQMLAASFLSPQEVLSLTGIEDFTLSIPILEALNSTPTSTESKALVSEVLKKWDINQDLTGDCRQRGPLTAEEIQVNKAKAGKGGWLDQESEAGKSLLKALKSERVDWLMKDALKIFGKAEVDLRELCGKKSMEKKLDLGL